MLRECIQTVEEVSGDMEEGQPRFITTVLTCEGDLQDPSFPNRLESLVGKLNRLISEEKEPFCVEKVEPWNSVRVTFTIPWDAALRLRELAQQGDQVLRDLGILSVQIEGDQVITLTLANRYSEPQELVFKTSTNADVSSEAPNFGLELPEGHSSSAKAIDHLLSQAIKPSADAEVASRSLGNASRAPEETTVNGSIAFQSPNVVAPSNQSSPPFKTNAAALMSQKSYTQNPVSSGPFPFASMTYAMNTKHAAANSQSTKHIQGCSSRFPFTPPLQRSASSAWMPYVSHKAVTPPSSSAATNIPSNTNFSQPNLLSASQHENERGNVAFSNASFGATGEVEETAVSRTTKANNVLSSPLLVNLLQNETGSKIPHSSVSPVSSPTLQPPAKRKRKPRKPKEANAVSARTSRSDVINCHTISLPASVNSAPVTVSQNLSVASSSKIQSLCKTLSPFFPAPSPEEQTYISNKSRSPLHRENSVIPNNVPFQSFHSSNFSVRNFQTAANSLHDSASVGVVCTTSSRAVDHPTKSSSHANNESKKLGADGAVGNCTPFPSPPPSADGKVKHLINPFTGHLEPMPSDDDEDDECIGSLSLFPELEMMDTNDGAESDKNISDRCEDKQNLQKVPVSECMQDRQINIDTHPVKKDVVDALMYRKPDVYMVSPCVSSIGERNYSLARTKNVNPSDLSKSSPGVQRLGRLRNEIKKSLVQKDIHSAIENPKTPVRSTTPITNGNSPRPAQVSQVDLSFLQPHLQNWKVVSNKGKNMNVACSSYVKPRVAENFVDLSKGLVRAKHQENAGKLTNANVVNSVERSKYSYNLLNSSKPLSMSSEVLKGSHSVNDSFYALKSRIPEHNLNLQPEFSVSTEKPCSNIDSVNLPVKDLRNATFTRPATFFNKLTVLDLHSVDRTNSNVKQVCHVNTGSPKNINSGKLQLDDKAVCLSELGFHSSSPGNVETYEKDTSCVRKGDEANVGISQPAESLAKKPVSHEANSNFSTPLSLESYSSAASCNTSPSIVVSSCDRQGVMSSQANSLFRPSPDNSDIKEFKQSSPLDRHVISPESNPHFETPPDSRSPISSINSNDKLPAESVNSFDIIRKETLFNPEKHDRFLAEMMDSRVEIRRHNENNSEQCSMSSLITPNSTFKPELSMHKKWFENIPLYETPSSNKAIFSINNSPDTAYSGSGKKFISETGKSQNELLTVLDEKKLDQEISCSVLSQLQDQSKSVELNSPVDRRNSTSNYSTCSDELRKSGAGSLRVSNSSVSYQSFDGTAFSASASYRGKDSTDDLPEKTEDEQEGHFPSGSVAKSSKTYDFMDNNISKPPEQLPLEIFENSESESQSPASSFDGESHTYFAGKGKQGLTVPSTVCGPIESHLSSQDQFLNTSPSDSSEKDASVSSPRFVSHEVLAFGTCQEPLRNILFENSFSVTSPSELSGKCSVSQTTSDRTANNPLSCVVSNVSSVCTGGSVTTTTSVANVPCSFSLSVPTVSVALPKSTCESTRKFANGSAFRSYHVDVSHSKNVDGPAALEETFPSATLDNSASLHCEASVASSQTGSTAAPVNHNKSKELTNSLSRKVPDVSIHGELEGSSKSSFVLSDNYPLLTSSAEFGKTDDRFSTDFAEGGANGYNGHIFTSGSRYDNGLSLNISDNEDSKLLLSRSREMDPFPNYNALAQKLISSVDDKLVSEIKCKLNISRDLKLNKISNIDSSFSPDLQHVERYENNNCVTIVSAEELHTASKKSNRSYSEDSFGDSSVESPYRNSDPLELEYCDYKFDSVDRSLRPKHRNGSTCLIEDEANSPSEISGSLLFTSASDISSPNAKMVFQSTREKIKTLNGRKDVNAACAIVEIRNASLFDGTKLLNPRKKCILSPRIGGEEQLQGIKRRRLSADSLR